MRSPLALRTLLAPLFAVALTLTPALAGCAAVALAGAGYIISRDVLPNEFHTAQVKDDVDKVWASTRETLEILADLPAGPPVFEESPRSAKLEVDRSRVEVTVEAFDLDETVIGVRARTKLGANDASTADLVLERILARLREE